MKFLLAVALAGAAIAAPVKRAVTDADILQFALTLEHLENTFYKQALAKFTDQDFINAGYDENYFSNLKYIAHDEEAHVTGLSAALMEAGAKPVEVCEYSFPYTDPKSFVTLSSVIEGVGTSAYLGAAGLIQSKEYLGVAGAILVTEALHTSLQRYVIKEVAPANAYGTALGVNEVFTLAGAFIKSCPSTNTMIPVKAFPALVAAQGMPTAPGISFAFKPPMASMSGQMFVTYINGLNTISVPASMTNGMLTSNIPMMVSGQTYAVLTNQNVTKALTDDMVIAGPAILEVTPASPTFDDSIM